MDIQVHEETSARVDLLTDGIDRILKRISGRTTRARQYLGPVAQHSGMDQYRENVNSVLDSMNELREFIGQIDGAGKVLRAGPGETGLDNFAKAQRDLERLQTKLTSSPYRSFTGLVESTQKLELQGHQSLQDHILMVINRTYPPPDSAEYFGTGNSIPPTDPSRLAVLRQVVDVYDNSGRSEDVNSLLGAAFAEYVRHALKTQPLDTNDKLKAYVAYNKDVGDHLSSSIEMLFGDDPSRTSRLKGIVAQATKTEHNKVSQGLSSSSSSGDGMAVFDNIESALVLGSSGSDIASLNTQALDKLRSIYNRVDQTSRQGKIEGETSISGATVTVLSTLRGLSKRHQGVEAALADASQRAYLPSPAPEWVSRFPASQDTDRASLFFADCLECLNHNLTTAVRNSGFRPPQQGIFLLFNLATVEHYVESNHISDAVGGLVQTRLEKNNKQAFKLFLSDWEKLSHNLLDQTITAAKPGTKLSSKDREAVKEKFRQFNSEFENLVERQKRYNITDVLLRQRIAHEISQLIRPLYKRFYDKHSGGDFTKNLDKYLKYDMSQLDNMLASMA